MTHAENASVFLKNKSKADWHDQTLWYVRQKRDAAVQSVPNWENLRNAAEAIKRHTMSHLDQYLEEFEKNAVALGTKVHWAQDADEHNKIVLNILQANNVRNVVKSKSMLTEECGLNPFLEKNGISVVDTDLGERIVQLREEPPSHIVLPAIHLRKEEVGALFAEKLGAKKGESDPVRLTEIARNHLREKFLNAEVGITGVNFGIAETGGFVVCTNEGNADLGTALPPVHIACMGIEKLVPRLKDLFVFIKLLARSATGQHVTTYTSLYHGPGEGKEIHIVIVDNGRSDLLSMPEHQKSLFCIRCGACLNTCPVYRRSGGHSYGYSIPGPIGSILAPFKSIKSHWSLPFASTLCGSCRDICPVKVDLDVQHFALRQEIVNRKLLPANKRIMIHFMGILIGSSIYLRTVGRIVRKVVKLLPRSILYNRFNVWGRQRELPIPPEQSFQDWYRINRRSVK